MVIVTKGAGQAAKTDFGLNNDSYLIVKDVIRTDRRGGGEEGRGGLMKKKV